MVVSFSPEKGLSLPMCSSSVIKNSLSPWTENPAASAKDAADMATVSLLRWPASSHKTALNLARSSGVTR